MTDERRDPFEHDLADDLAALADTPLPGRKTPEALAAAAAADGASWWRRPVLAAAAIVAVIATGVVLSFDPAATAQQSSSPGPSTASPGLIIAELRYTCRGADHPFTASSLKEPPLNLLTDPAGNVLSTFIAGSGGGRLPRAGWHDVGRDEWSATFVAAELGIPIAFAHLRRLADGWEVKRWGTGCDATPVVGGANPADWQLADDQRITAQTTSFLVEVTERSCVGGQSSEDRVRPPIVDYGAEHIAIAFTVERPAAGDLLYFCIANPPSRVRVELSEPVGDRILWDAGSFPWEHRSALQSEPRANPEAILGPWRVVGGFVDGETIAPERDAPIELSIEDDMTFGGHSGCNGYGGSLQVQPGRISFGELSTEHLLCQGSISVMEGRYYYALARTQEFALVDGHLHMIGPGASLEFERSRRMESTAGEIAELVISRLEANREAVPEWSGSIEIVSVEAMVLSEALAALDVSQSSDPPNDMLGEMVWLVRANGPFVSYRGLRPAALTGTSGYFVIEDTTGTIIATGFDGESLTPPSPLAFRGDISQLLVQAEQLMGHRVRVTGEIGVVAEGGPLLTLTTGGAGIGEILVLFDTRLNGGEYSLDYRRRQPAVVVGTLLELTAENIDSVGDPFIGGAAVIDFMQGPQFLIIATEVIQD